MIAGGNAPEDAVITATAKVLKQYPGPILLRWSWEFNVYGKNQNCRSIDPSVGPTQQVYADFIAAWQHIRTLFQAAGASNVSFVWNPGHWNADGDPKDPQAFYPGNAFVDWLAIDTYQRAANGTFSDDFDLFYNDFSQPQYGNKPMLVGENGGMGFSEHMAELQATYLQGLLAALKANKYPLFKGYCYFDSNGTLGNWVLDDNGGKGQGGLAAFAALSASPPFAPAISLVANAEGENPVIAPNTWIEIKGSNLAPAGVSRIWRAADFVNGQLPAQLDGVTVTVGGKPAYVYYISPTQVNVLTAQDIISGQVPVVVINNGAVTAAATVQAQALSPSFFVFDGVHVAAVHASGDLLGPTALYPGYTTPAKPGETVLLYANGFGSTSIMQGVFRRFP